jgi:deferrochelatase/peroxidase EfeB
MTARTGDALELDDIHAGTMRAPPSPCVGVYLLLRVDHQRAGRELLKRLIPALDPGDRNMQAYLFPQELSQGMAARAEVLRAAGESSPDHWESPLGSPDVHIALAALSPDTARLEATLQRAGDVLRGMPGVEAIWRQDVYALASERTSFGFKDGISHPARR